MTAGPIHIAGDWRGSYFYDVEKQRPPDGSGVGFELRLSQWWLMKLIGRFSGTVKDDRPHGMPEAGRISGRLRGTSICFTEWMPVSYVSHEGRSVSLREWLRSYGRDPGHELPHPPISYRGVFSSENAASGTWKIESGHLDLGARGRIPMPGCTGTWELKKVA